LTYRTESYNNYIIYPLRSVDDNGC